MSFQDMAWAVKQKCDSPGQKLVLLMLANHCNGHTKQCNPSHKRLAEECCMGVSTLKRNIASLAKAGLLTIEHRTHDGVSLPNQYRLTPPKLEEVGPNRTDGQPKLGRGVGPNRAKKQEVKSGIEPLGADAPLPAAKLPACPAQLIVALYHEILPEMPSARLLGEPRKRAISGFWKFVLSSKRSDGTARATDKDSALDWIKTYFERARNNNFLMGRGKKSPGHEGWACDIDFLMSEKGRIQVIEKTRDQA